MTKIIRVGVDLYDYLEKLKTDGETFDDVLRRLLDMGGTHLGKRPVRRHTFGIGKLKKNEFKRFYDADNRSNQPLHFCLRRAMRYYKNRTFALEERDGGYIVYRLE